MRRASIIGLIGSMTVAVTMAATSPAIAQPDPTASAEYATADSGGAIPRFHEIEGRLATGLFHACAVLDNGDTKCWGRNTFGQLGHATNVGTDDPTPEPLAAVPLVPDAVELAAGATHTCARQTDGAVRCWGGNDAGQLGDPSMSTTGAHPVPGQAVPLGRPASALAAGPDFTCALLDDGDVRCWGRNTVGELGTVAPDTGATPRPPIALDRPAVAISAGTNSACAILDNGWVRCWGSNRNAELGFLGGGSDAHPIPASPVHLSRPAVAISSGSFAGIGGAHTCAILDNRLVECWGWSTSRQADPLLPVGVIINPVLVRGAGATGVVAAGATHTCTASTQGAVWCWGEDITGVVPPDPSAERVPVELDVGGRVLAVASGYGFACALVVDGRIECWGRNEFGQLGVGATAGSSVRSAPPAGPVALPKISMNNRMLITNVIASGPAEYDFLFGKSYEQVFTGDWNGDGHDGFARRNDRTIVEVDEAGNPLQTVTFGPASVTGRYRVGDWDGNGTDTFAIQNGNVFDVTNSPTGTGPTFKIGYGRAGDEVFVGDFDGNGTSTLAVRRGNVFYLRNSVSTGVADIVFGYGRAGDEVLVGDWDHDGTETFAVRRGNVIYIRNDFQTGIAQSTIGYGQASDILLVGDWNGDNVDSFAVQRFE